MSSNVIVRGVTGTHGRACVPVVIVDDGIDDEGAEDLHDPNLNGVGGCEYRSGSDD